MRNLSMRMKRFMATLAVAVMCVSSSVRAQIPVTDVGEIAATGANGLLQKALNVIQKLMDEHMIDSMDANFWSSEGVGAAVAMLGEQLFGAQGNSIFTDRSLQRAVEGFIRSTIGFTSNLRYIDELMNEYLETDKTFMDYYRTTQRGRSAIKAYAREANDLYETLIEITTNPHFSISEKVKSLNEATEKLEKRSQFVLDSARAEIRDREMVMEAFDGIVAIGDLSRAVVEEKQQTYVKQEVGGNTVVRILMLLLTMTMAISAYYGIKRYMLGAPNSEFFFKRIVLVYVLAMVFLSIVNAYI